MIQELAQLVKGIDLDIFLLFGNSISGRPPEKSGGRLFAYFRPSSSLVMSLIRLSPRALRNRGSSVTFITM